MDVISENNGKIEGYGVEGIGAFEPILTVDTEEIPISDPSAMTQAGIDSDGAPPQTDQYGGYTDENGVYHMPGGDPVFTVEGTGTAPDSGYNWIWILILAALVYLAYRYMKGRN